MNTKYIHTIGVIVVFFLSWEFWQRWQVREYEALDDCWPILTEVDELRDQKEFVAAHSKLKFYRQCSSKFVSEMGMRYYYHLGWLQHDEGKYKRAIKSYNKGLKKQKKYPYAYWRRGLAKEALGKQQEAGEDFKVAYKMGIELYSDEFLAVLDNYPEIKQKLTDHLKN